MPPFPGPLIEPLPTRRNKAWSPIDRMIGSSSKGRRCSPPRPKTPRQLQRVDLPQLPSMPATLPWDVTLVHAPPAAAITTTATVGLTAVAGTQTSPWSALMAEALVPERLRADDFEAEVVELQARLRHVEEHSSARIAQLETERQALRAECDEERQHAREELADLIRQLSAAAAEGDRRGQSKLEGLRRQLEDNQQECVELRLQCTELRDSCKGLADERDELMVRLEREQIDMMARVEAMERRMSKTSR